MTWMHIVILILVRRIVFCVKIDRIFQSFVIHYSMKERCKVLYISKTSLVIHKNRTIKSSEVFI